MDTEKAVLARTSHLEFMRYAWEKNNAFIDGYHITEICKRIDMAMDDYRNGKSSFLAISLPFRHGGSSIVSKYLTANFSGKFPGKEIIISTYSHVFSDAFDWFAKNITKTREYKDVYPSASKVKATACNPGSSLKGVVGDLIVYDSLFRNMGDANNQLKRDSAWKCFKDVLAKREPVSIVIAIGARWHKDDVFGRIKSEMTNDPDFPRFKEIKFPAFDDKYPQGVLFPERFPKEWYISQKSILGPYGTAALLQCEPI